MRVAAIVVQLGVAAGLVLFGRWGRRNAAALAPASLPPAERERRERTTTRGAVACQVAGAAFAAINLALFF
ncbi:MAG: hypothetical protein JWQ81_719 [Amycolatopsis sp.]|jgi:hypothetical protein|uniref:hypothetical protein n=1 Tax=Amycolatopsis sp. TaxID=37632 RepID=UPI0026320E9B|nr:hypothetical protein [Amycolatopsis sp.]MCU1679980.1 hypothetical protein [Amycolatopsis sp.]